MVWRRLAWLRAAILLLALTAARSVLAGSSGDSQTVGNVVIYLGLLPAPMTCGHPPDHPECRAGYGMDRHRSSMVRARRIKSAPYSSAGINEPRFGHGSQRGFAL